MTGAKKEDAIVLERVVYIHYAVQFRKRSKEVTRALINPSSEVNAINATYAKQLYLQICQTNVEA